MTPLNVIGCGRVGQTFARLLHLHGACAVQDLLSRSEGSAARAAAFIGAGRAVASLQDMRDADIWMLSVPDSQVAQLAHELAAVLQARGGPPAGAIVFHCSGFLAADTLAPLHALGWQAASVHPVLNVASAETGVAQFAGTPCGLEGDAPALAVLRPLLQAIGAECFDVRSQDKPLYHAGAVFASNFMVVLQALAREAWQAAGVPSAVLPRVHQALLRATVDNVLALGPAQAITGPAARGDTAVVQAQQRCIQAWHPAAGAVYEQLSALARQLALQGRTHAPAPEDAGG